MAETELKLRQRTDGRLDRTRDPAILNAALAELREHGYSQTNMNDIAARAGVGKAAIYRRWRSKQALAQEVLVELAAPHIAVPETGDTREELLAAVVNPMRAVTETPFGPVIRSLMSQIATDPKLGDPFRATVVQARRGEVARVIERGIARGDLRPDADPTIATELLVGPVYFRVMFGGELSLDFANRVVDAVIQGFGVTQTGPASARRRSTAELPATGRARHGKQASS